MCVHVCVFVLMSVLLCQTLNESTKLHSFNRYISQSIVAMCVCVTFVYMYLLNYYFIFFVVFHFIYEFMIISRVRSARSLLCNIRHYCMNNTGTYIMITNEWSNTNTLKHWRTILTFFVIFFFIFHHRLMLELLRLS